MILSFKHKGLERFFHYGTKSGIQPRHAAKLRILLGRLNAASHIADMNAPGLGLHELSGLRKGTWSIRISGNWRVTFGFIDGDAVAVSYEDYH